MLSKLIKHEWKILFKHNSIIFLTLLLATITASLTLIISGNINHYSPIALFPVLFFYYLILITVPLATLIVFAIRYYKSCYGNEGYLTNTLPVSSSKIVFSKLFTGALYMLIVSFFLLLSMATVIISWLAFSKDLPLDELSLSLQTFPSFKEVTNLSIPLFIIIILVILVLSSFSSISMAIGSVSLGHLWKKHKIFGSLVSYVGIYFVIQIISLIFIMPATTKLTIDVIYNSDPYLFIQGYTKLMIIYVPTLSFITTIALYFISRYILKKKINLD